MTRFKFFISALFIAPELVVILLATALPIYLPDFFTTLGKNIRSDPEIWKFVPTFTLTFAAVAFTISAKVRAPLDSFSNKILYEWPHYQFLVDRVYISLFYSVVAGVAGLYLWFFGNILSEKQVGALFLGSTGSAAITALLMFLVPQKLREYIERFSP